MALVNAFLILHIDHYVSLKRAEILTRRVDCAICYIARLDGARNATKRSTRDNS